MSQYLLQYLGTTSEYRVVQPVRACNLPRPEIKMIIPRALSIYDIEKANK
jgi:hypothetical protein